MRVDDLGQQGCHDLRQFGPGPRQIMNHLEPPRSHRRAQRLTRSQPQQIARRQRPDHAARLVDHSEVAHLAFGRSPDRRTRPQGPPPTACSSGARPACAASRLHSGRPPARRHARWRFQKPISRSVRPAARPAPVHPCAWRIRHGCCTASPASNCAQSGNRARATSRGASIGARRSQCAFDQLPHQRQPKRKDTPARLLLPFRRTAIWYSDRRAHANIHRCLSAPGRLPVGQ